MTDVPAPISVERLRELVAEDEVETVLVAFVDFHGQLQGKRLHPRHFLDHIGPGRTRTELHPAFELPGDAPGAEGWGEEFGHLALRPDLLTLRRAPWAPRTALVQADVVRPDGAPVHESPRRVLAAQLAQMAELGFTVRVRPQLEFLTFVENAEVAREAGYRGLTPGHRAAADGASGEGRLEVLLRELRGSLHRAGVDVEALWRGRCPGQLELALAPTEALAAADALVVARATIRELASRHGRSVTFMARPASDVSNACFLQLDLAERGDGGAAQATAADPGDAEGEPGEQSGRSWIFRSFLAGVLTTLREFTLLYAPTVNSYKRLRPGTLAPTVVAWGEDNRTCAVRVVERGSRLWIENRVPGGDVNPYLALAATVAGGLYGIRSRQPLEPGVSGSGFTVERPRIPSCLADAQALFADSVLARGAFGDDVVDHFLRAAQAEQEAFDDTVTDWELHRGFERT